MINSPDLSPDSISIFSASTRPITTGRRWATFPTATTTTGWLGSSLSTAKAGTSGTFDRCSASISTPTWVPGCSAVGVSKARVTSTVFAPVSGIGRGDHSEQFRVGSAAPKRGVAARGRAFGGRAGGRADRKSACIGNRHRGGHLHLFRIDQSQNRIGVVCAHLIARIVQTLGDRPVERRADGGVLALAFGDADRRLDGNQLSFGRGELAIGVVHLAPRRGALVDQRPDAALRQLRLLHAKLCGLHRGLVDDGLRAKRRKLEPHEHLAAFHRVADVLRDLGDTCGLGGDDGECGARQSGDESGCADGARMFPRRTGSAMTGIAGSASVSRPPLRRHAGRLVRMTRMGIRDARIGRLADW